MWRIVLRIFRDSRPLTAAYAAIALISSQSAAGQVNTPGCVPVEQRAGREVGYYILVIENLGRLPHNEVFWTGRCLTLGLTVSQ